MRIAILGSGAVGGYYGAKLARAGHHVTFLARGAHLRAIRERGLLVWSPIGDFVARGAATDDPAAVSPAPDLVIVAVKGYDNATAFSGLRPLCGPETTVLTLQNGVESAEEIAAIVGRERVLAGPAYVATALKAPGLIVQTGTHRRIVFGEVFDAPAEVTGRVRELAALLCAADIQAEAVADARVPLWEKLVYLAPLAGCCAAMRRPTGAVWGDDFAREVFLAAAREVEAVARAEGVAVSADVLAKVRGYMDALPQTMVPSLLIDLSAGKRLELEALQGAVVRRGRARGVPTPILDTLYAVLRPWAAGTTGAA
ncbi:MAG: 2-dehydropantoate 2-reductase [Vicinamibacterales bacterium]|nr:2-dehydropantoate 2-reductase [Vicinamibacterales bacterium]